MLTGDRRRAAEAWRGEVGIGRVEAELLPDQKLDIIRRLQEEGRVVAHGGRRVERCARPGGGRCRDRHGHRHRRGHGGGRHHAGAAAICGRRARALDLSRRTLRIIRQNLAWAFGYNIVAIPVAAGLLYPAFGLLLSPAIAAAAMAMSSVSVVSNSLRSEEQ